ncbi:hypothetical protein IKF20_00555 [Candidatus Saccharibacteria bacterium]|nr:hypothetical protein [Candidatus Saccharibacteria bacterium]
MNLFTSKKSKEPASNQAALAEIVLRYIHDGVITTDKAGTIQFINPAAITMTECGSADKAVGLDCSLVLRLESKEGRDLPEAENPLIQAMRTGQAVEAVQVALIAMQSEKRIPIALSVLTVESTAQNRIITFRNITKELEEEGEQTEFISTASHEMRTPVATIDGYLSLCLNPQTATIDDRTRGYLTAAQAASKHLGKLFQDLLDVTKLDDGKVRPHFEPVEMVSLVKTISDDYVEQATERKISLKFGSDDSGAEQIHQIGQVVYGFVDVNFMREILDNLVENAIKYTPEGGSIYINVRGDGDRALINVTDTGIGISSEDIGHIFQKFYRADNSDTREIGGTGLGLYLVKQRVEAMGGKVWAESAFGEGSTFFVSLPRISSDEYEKRMIVVRQIQNQKKMMAQSTMPPAQSGVPMPIQPSATTQPPMPTQPAMSASAQPNTVASTAAPPNSPTAVPVGPPVTPPVNSPITNQNNIINNLNGEKR